MRYAAIIANLDSGGWMRVDGQFDLFALSQRDRELFNQVSDLFREFRKNSPPPAPDSDEAVATQDVNTEVGEK